MGVEQHVADCREAAERFQDRSREAKAARAEFLACVLVTFVHAHGTGKLDELGAALGVRLSGCTDAQIVARIIRAACPELPQYTRTKWVATVRWAQLNGHSTLDAARDFIAKEGIEKSYQKLLERLREEQQKEDGPALAGDSQDDGDEKAAAPAAKVPSRPKAKTPPSRAKRPARDNGGADPSDDDDLIITEELTIIFVDDAARSYQEIIKDGRERQLDFLVGYADGEFAVMGIREV